MLNKGTTGTIFIMSLVWRLSCHVCNLFSWVNQFCILEYISKSVTLQDIYILLFLSLDFCRFCVVSHFFIPATTANDLRLRSIFYPRFYPLHFFPHLISSERASISLLMLSAKQGNYWYHFYLWYDAFLVGRLNPGPPALEASTLPLGYRGGNYGTVFTHLELQLSFFGLNMQYQ